MKKYLIIYEYNGARFFCQNQAETIEKSLVIFATEQKLTTNSIISIDIL